MKTLVMLVSVAIAAVATIAASQEANPTPVAAGAATAVTASGEIVRYDARKTIVLRQADDRVVTYALSPDVVVPPEVQVGHRVTIFAEPAADGVVRVTRVTEIGPAAARAPGSAPTAVYTRETEKAKTVTVTGDVVRYETGKTIVVRSADGREVAYAIAPDLTAPPEVTVGRQVSIVTVPSPGGPILVTKISTESVAADGQVKTTTQETAVAPSGAEVKTQTTAVFGTITGYEPGQTVTLTLPNKKVVTYALDASSSLPTGIATGKTVVVRTITRPGAKRPLVRKVTYQATTTTRKSG